jgi:hypothetical protein
MLASDGVFDALSDQADPRCFADLAASTLEPVEGLSRLSLPTLKSLSFFFLGMILMTLGISWMIFELFGMLTFHARK